MRLKLFLSMVVAFTILAFCCVVMAGETEKEDHAFVGVKKCKICHKKSGIFESWGATTHATAYDGLTDEEKADKELMKYYTTGTTAKGDLLTGVQCESCHGAGADYKKKKVMQDREVAVAAGLVIPTEETCLSCHNDKAPAKVAAVAKDFDLEKLKAKGVHMIPVAETEEGE
ncbi:MAG: hypothetical protein J7J98_08055 [candidate division Zixibacteria bacterium]|nr:hypothetical protein [candidate division Zixibacteria bacterium]